jgi:hypothetical protein
LLFSFLKESTGKCGKSPGREKRKITKKEELIRRSEEDKKI